MRKNLLIIMVSILCADNSTGQVTQLNSNNSLHFTYALSPTKTILVSTINKSIWVSDGTPAGTVQIAPGIGYELTGGVINGKLIFTGTSLATGSEVFITDGTTAGTVVLKNIRTGTASSFPDDFEVANNEIYFTASTALEGREVWKTDGTTAGTSMLKDIMSGSGDSNQQGLYNMTYTGSYVLFAAESTGNGIELWKSDGTPGGTVQVKDINAGADASNPRYFTQVNNIVLFFATDAANGEELWKTNGTDAGTVLVKDINPGTGNSTSFFYLFYNLNIFIGFHKFGNDLYFNASDGVSIGEMWKTDGSTGGTVLVKDIIPGADPAVITPLILLPDAINLSSKFIFPVSDGTDRFELWESDGTPGGTQLFKSFDGSDATAIPFIYPPFAYDPDNLTLSQPLFMGDKFFFSAGSTAEGIELWVSDGTLPGTTLVKDINPGAGNGIDATTSISYAYTDSYLFFAANDGTNGSELWKTDGTAAGTSMVQDINPDDGDASPELTLVPSGKLFFSGSDGDNGVTTDFFIVDGSFSTLPVKLISFTVAEGGSDAILNWRTAQEINFSNFSVQRSFDAEKFEDIGKVAGTASTANAHAYTFADRGVLKTGKSIIYYRLISNDLDGKQEKSPIISLRLRNTAKWNIKVLSNPVRNNVQMLLQDVTNNIHLSLIDFTGRIFFKQSYPPTNGQLTLPAQLSAGAYLLVVETNNERKIIKIIK